MVMVSSQRLNLPLFVKVSVVSKLYAEIKPKTHHLSQVYAYYMPSLNLTLIAHIYCFKLKVFFSFIYHNLVCPGFIPISVGSISLDMA